MPVSARLDRLLLAPPALLLLVLPFAHTTALRSLALALTVAAAIYVWSRDPGPAVPLKLPLALFAGLALASLAWARHPAYTLGEIRADVALDVVYFLAFFALTRERRHWNVFRVALLAGLAVMTVVAAWTYARTGALDSGYLGGQLSLSTHMTVLFPLLAVGAFDFPGDRRVTAIAALGAAAALLVGYFTFNRMFILAILASGVVVAVLLVRRRAGVPVRRVRTLVLVGAVSVAAALAFFASVAQHRAQVEHGGLPVRATIERDPRWEIWTYSLELIRERPLTGVGYGLFAAEDRYRERFSEGTALANTHAHNPFLNAAVQMGVGGVAALLFLLFSLFRELRTLYRSDEAQVRLIGVAGLALLTGVLIKSQTDDLWGRHNGYLYWALTGMMLGHAHRLLRRDGAVKTGPAR
jgi:O-antigen ligase